MFGIYKIAADGSQYWWSDGFLKQPYWINAAPNDGWYVSMERANIAGQGDRFHDYGLYHVNNAGLVERIAQGNQFAGLAHNGATLFALNKTNNNLTTVQRIDLDISDLSDMRECRKRGCTIFFTTSVNQCATTLNRHNALLVWQKH